MHSHPSRRLLVASLGIALGALAAANVAGAGPNDGAIAALQDEIGTEEAKIGTIEQQIGTIEQQVATIEQQITDLRDLVAEGDQAIMNLEAEVAEAEARIASEAREIKVLLVRVELLADLTIGHYADLEEPTTVRHVMAIDSYVKNDERINAVLTQSVEASGETLDNLRTQMLYEAVIDSATNDLHQRYALLRLDGDRARSLYGLMASSEERSRIAVDDRDGGIAIIPTVEGRIASSEDEIAAAHAEIADEQSKIAAAQAEIADIHESIADVLAEIAWLDSFNVSMTWTGLQGNDPHRPALTVKIDNASAARPQTGINEADVVYEEVVEAGLTRFVAIFQTTSPGTVGPVRSGRTSDPILLEGFDRPLYAYSGANRGTNQAINASPLVDVGYDDAASAYWRSSSRRAPHNLYASTDSLWALHADRTDVPPAPFTFGWEGQPLPDSAIAAEGVTIDFGRLVADYAWDGSGWQRSTNGEAHSDAEGVQVAPTNVVIQFTTYGKSAADFRSPEARTTGSGTAWVFTAGHLMVAEWNRPDPGRPATITIDGEPVLLQPGRTWVALADAARPGNVAWR